MKTGILPARNDKLEKPPGFRQCDELASIRAVVKKSVRFAIIMRPQLSGSACALKSTRSKSGAFSRQKLMNTGSEISISVHF
ncbi:MAG TPA: hypothetical protein VLN58_15670 [Verrucomicrobiae bacterium]|nr:hypothetical protein [Verrucomicrobiae bacterium]